MTIAVARFSRYNNLTLKIDEFAIGKFCDVRRLAGGQLVEIFEILENARVSCAAALVKNFDLSAAAIVGDALKSMSDGVRRVCRLQAGGRRLSRRTECTEAQNARGFVSQCQRW